MENKHLQNNLILYSNNKIATHDTQKNIMWEEEKKMYTYSHIYDTTHLQQLVHPNEYIVVYDSHFCRGVFCVYTWNTHRRNMIRFHLTLNNTGLEALVSLVKCAGSDVLYQLKNNTGRYLKSEI